MPTNAKDAFAAHFEEANQELEQAISAHTQSKKPHARSAGLYAAQIFSKRSSGVPNTDIELNLIINLYRM